MAAHDDSDARLMRLESSVSPLKSTLRALCEREESSSQLVRSLASSVETLAIGTAQGYAETFRALAHREEAIRGLVTSLASSAETLKEEIGRAHAETLRQAAEINVFRSKLTEIGDAVAKHDAVPERLAVMVGRAFKDCMEVGLAALDQRTTETVKASEDRMIARLEKGLSRIENKLEAILHGFSTQPVVPVEGQPCAQPVKWEDWIHSSDSQPDPNMYMLNAERMRHFC